MSTPPNKFGQREPRSYWRPIAIGVSVFALVSATVVVLIAVAFVMSMSSFGSNK